MHTSSGGGAGRGGRAGGRAGDGAAGPVSADPGRRGLVAGAPTGCARSDRAKADDVALAPAVHLAGEFVDHLEALGPAEAERGHPQFRLPPVGTAAVQRRDHDDGVAGLRVTLGEAQQLVVRDGVEPQALDALQGRVGATDPVQLADQRLQGVVVLLGRPVVAGAQLVLLRVQVFLATRSDGLVLVQLEAGVHPPGRRHRRRQHGPDGEHARSAELQGGVQDVRRVDEEVGPHVVRSADQLDAVVDQFLLLGAPGEIRVGLAEADPTQLVHHRRPGERLGQEDRVRGLGVDLRDQPLPEVDRLGVRVVDPENGHPVGDPELDHP